jgi:hypothetical protein
LTAVSFVQTPPKQAPIVPEKEVTGMPRLSADCWASSDGKGQRRSGQKRGE